MPNREISNSGAQIKEALSSLHSQGFRPVTAGQLIRRIVELFPLNPEQSLSDFGNYFLGLNQLRESGIVQRNHEIITSPNKTSRIFVYSLNDSASNT